MLVALVLFACAPSPVNAVSVATTAELRAALTAAKPGTRIELAPGNYEGFHAAAIAGTAAAPIVVTGADANDPPVFEGGVHLADVAHLALARIVVERAPANGINIDDAGTFETPSHHVVVEDVVVRDCGGRANADGIKLSGVEDVTIRRCTIERWGRAGSAVDLVGCRRVTIEACTLRDRADDAAASGVQAKGGSRAIAIRACRFEHAGQRAVNIGGSTGKQFFRPRPEGFEAKDVVVEGCTFVGAQAPIAFVGVDGATVRFNTFVRPQRWLVRILQETQDEDFVPCRAGAFTDNLVVYDARTISTLVNVGPKTAPETFTFARNYWHRVDDPARSIPALPTREVDPAGGADPLLRDAGAAGADPLLRDAGDAAGAVADDSPARAHGAHAFKSAAAK